MTQNASIRNGNRKNTTANADRMETAIFPNVMTSATTMLLTSIGQIGGRP
jgi:hypothetical protein